MNEYTFVPSNASVMIYPEDNMPKLYAKDGVPLDQNYATVKFFGGTCTWHLTEYDPEDELAFGLCDLGMGYPELGYVSLAEIRELKFPRAIERDLYYTPITLRQALDNARG